MDVRYELALRRTINSEQWRGIHTTYEVYKLLDGDLIRTRVTSHHHIP
jgi:hypothetical protein